MKTKKKKISRIITICLVVTVMLACAVAAIITYFLLSKRSERQMKALVKQNVEDVSADMEQLVEELLLSFAYSFIVEDYITTANVENPKELSKMLYDAYSTDGTEVNVINSDGIIIASSVPEYIGYDMHDGEQSAEFLVLLEDEEMYIQDFQGVSYDESVLMKYAGMRFPDGSGFIQVGLTEEMYYEQINGHGQYATINRRIGETGYLLVCDEDLNILSSYHDEYTGKTAKEAGLSIDEKKEYNYKSLKCDMFGKPCYVNINKVQSIYVIGVCPEREAINSVNTIMGASLLLEVIVFAILLLALIILLRKLVVENMVKVNNGLAQITEGNLDEKIDVHDTYEFDMLSMDINEMVDKLKGYIEEAAARIDADLEVAKAIQTSALPNVFPPFPGYKEFELYASMRAAKEVGGDFYDFYMIGDDILGFLIADVSGKSIPGAMFMMRGKAIIKSLVESGLSPAEVFTIANKKLCEGNDAELFITAWLGYLDLKTGDLHVANAGHNPPVLVRDGKAEFLMLRPGLMLAGMEDIVYKEHSTTLQKGDILYLYTDGVTEAMDTDENLYGNERLLNLLSFENDYPEPKDNNGVAGAVCSLVSDDIDSFVNGAEQSDDITMLCVRFLGEAYK